MAKTHQVQYFNNSTPPHITTLILLASLPALAMSIFLPSLPSMSSYFKTDYTTIQLSVSLYLGVSALLQLIISPLADRYGRRPVVLWSIAIFNIASFGCIFAPNVEIFLFFRMLQATIATCMALSRAVVRDMFPESQAASMIGYVTMAMSISPMLAPLLGGVFDTYAGWQANFWFMAAVGILLFFIVWRDMGETAPSTSKSLMAQMKQYPELLGSRRFWGYCLCSTLSAGAYFAYLGGAPFVGGVLFSLNAIWLGLSFGAVSVGYMTGNFISGRFSVRYGINKMVLAGTIIAVIGMLFSLLLFYMGAGSAGVFFGFMVLLGLGNGMVLPNANAGMLSIKPELAGSASGLGGAILLVGATILSMLSGAMLSPQSGAFPLLWIMLLCSVFALIAIIYVIKREAKL